MKISGLVMCMLALPLSAQRRTVTCASTSGQQQVCNADTHNGVLLVHETSHDVCRQGDTWSYDRHGITVSGGCAGDFLTVARTHGDYGNGNGNNNYGNRNDGNANDSDSGNNRNNDNRESGNQYSGNRQNGNGNSRFMLPSGTQLPVRIEQAVRPSQLQQGTLLSGVLNSDVNTSNGTIPSGSRVQMKVNSQQGQALDLRLDSIVLNGQSYRLQTDAVSTGSDGQTGGGLGGFLNALSGGGTLQSGTVLNFTLTADAR